MIMRYLLANLRYGRACMVVFEGEIRTGMCSPRSLTLDQDADCMSSILYMD